MGKKMAEGGIVKRVLVDGMDEDNTSEGIDLPAITRFLVLKRQVSQGKYRRIHHYDCGWPSRSYPAHDQCDRYGYLKTGFRIQR